MHKYKLYGKKEHFIFGFISINVKKSSSVLNDGQSGRLCTGTLCICYIEKKTQHSDLKCNEIC